MFKVLRRKLIRLSGSGGLRYELKRNSLRVFAKRSPDPPRAGPGQGSCCKAERSRGHQRPENGGSGGGGG